MKSIRTAIKTISTCKVDESSNEQIKLRKQDLVKHTKTIASLSAKFKEYIEPEPSTTSLDAAKKDYDTLIALWESYSAIISKEFKDREIDKIDSFNKSQLNITLGKFGGYDSSTNIYEFKTNFTKLFSQSVPTHLQADLLKNNYLEKDALTLVKNVSEIKEIWERLKEAYGNTKTLLTNKISELINCEAVKSKDPTKIINDISKISNLMRDLMQLSTEHHIENELYYSDAFDQACNLLGDERSTRWLTISCETPKEGR